MILNGEECKKLTQSEQIFAQCFHVLNIVMIFVCENLERLFDAVGERGRSNFVMRRFLFLAIFKGLFSMFLKFFFELN